MGGGPGVDLKKKLRQEAQRAGLNRIGIAGIQPFCDEQEVLNQRLKEGLITQAAAGDIALRTHPEMVLPGAKSILCVGACYHLPDDSSQDSRLARYARVRDYHKVLERAIHSLADAIRAEVPDARFVMSVDTGPLVERAAAQRAGVGFIGKNCSLIVPGMGSYLVLGALISTVPIPSDEVIHSGCGDCSVCLKACPTGALEAPGVVREERCLSFITQQRGWIASEFRSHIREFLWGCDRCQSVCPYNASTPSCASSLWDPNRDSIVLPDIPVILSWDAAAYRQFMEDTALFWRGRTVLQRNALLVLGNRKDQDDVPLLNAMLHDPRPVIRGHAAWALGQNLQPKVADRLRYAEKDEKDDQVLREIRQALSAGIGGSA